MLHLPHLDFKWLQSCYSAAYPTQFELPNVLQTLLKFTTVAGSSQQHGQIQLHNALASGPQCHRPSSYKDLQDSFKLLNILNPTRGYIESRTISVNIVNTSRIWNKKEPHATPMRFFSAPSQAMNGEEKYIGRHMSTLVGVDHSLARVQEHHRRQSSVPNLRQSLSCQLLALQ